MLAKDRCGFVFASLLTGTLLVAPLAGCHTDAASNVPDEEPPGVSVATEDILSGSNLPGTIDRPIAGDKMGVTIHRLPNGLTVYIATDRQKPRFNAWIAVRAGSRSDPAQSTGLAHYLEHMLFKGSDELGVLDAEAERPHLEKVTQLYGQLRNATGEERVGIFRQIDAATQEQAKYAVPNEMDRIYSTLGITRINAFTSYEQTVYVSDVPSNRLEAWATLEAERFADPSFRLFYPELEAVYEEKNRSIDSPSRRVDETMMLALFPEHPYGTQPTIGLVEHLKVPAFQDMVDYFHRWYHPNNMAVMLAGDIDADTALPVLEKTLGQWKPAALEPRKHHATPPVKGRQVHEVVADGEQSVVLAWQTVAVDHADEPVLEVMDWVMDNSSTGLMNLELTLPQKLPSAGSYGGNMNDGGFWVMRGTAKEGQSLEKVENLLLGVADKLKAGAFTQEDIDAVVLQQDINEKRRLEVPQASVSKMATAFIERREWKDVLARDARLRTVTKDDVVRAANKYITGDYVVVQRKRGTPDLPKIDNPSITPLEIDQSRQSEFGKKIVSMEAKELEPEWLEAGRHYTRTKLPAGELIGARNRRNDLFQLSYEFERGSKKAPGLCEAFELLDRSGAGDMSAEQLQRKMFSLGSNIRFDCQVESSSINVSGIDKNMDATLELLGIWLSQPKLEQDTLEKYIETTLSERRDRIDDQRWLGRALREFSRYGKKSDFLRDLSNKKLSSLKIGALSKLVSAAPNHQHTTLYFGPRTANVAGKAIGLGQNHKKVTDRAPIVYRKQKGARIYFLHKDVAKSSVGISWPHKDQGRDQRPSARLLSEYLGGGMSALIFQQIREARGLAYSAYGYMAAGERPKDDWALGGGMDTQVVKTIEATRTFLELIRDRRLEASRIDEAKNAAEQHYRSSRVDPRWIVHAVFGWMHRGEETDPRPWEREQVAKLGQTELEAMVTTYKDQPLIISVIGNRDRLSMKELAKIAPVTEVKPEQLFSWGKFPKVKAAKADKPAAKPDKRGNRKPNKRGNRKPINGSPD